MENSNLYPTIKEIEGYKKLLNKYKLTESALMKHQPRQIYDNSIIKKIITKSC